jgi:predicted dehydrogenase
MAIEAAKNHKHVIVEKPMDVTMEKTDQLIEVFKEENATL